MTKVMKTDAQWQELLGVHAFKICREKGTEPAFTGQYWDSKEPGVYICKCCSNELFSADTKYDSGSGWPSYFQPINDNAVSAVSDSSHSMQRIEVTCKHCDSHLGHVFTDGPQPTGLRYCINSASLTHTPKGSD